MQTNVKQRYSTRFSRCQFAQNIEKKPLGNAEHSGTKKCFKVEKATEKFRSSFSKTTTTPEAKKMMAIRIFNPRMRRKNFATSTPQLHTNTTHPANLLKMYEDKRKIVNLVAGKKF